MNCLRLTHHDKRELNEDMQECIICMNAPGYQRCRCMHMCSRCSAAYIQRIGPFCTVCLVKIRTSPKEQFDSWGSVVGRAAREMLVDVRVADVDFATLLHSISTAEQPTLLQVLTRQNRATAVGAHKLAQQALDNPRSIPVGTQRDFQSSLRRRDIRPTVRLCAYI